MYTHLDRIVEVIDRLNLTRMHAWDGDGHTIDTAECDSKTVLVDVVSTLVANTSGTIKLECWQAPPVRPVGVRKADVPKVERYLWRTRGTFGTATVADPVAPAAAPVVPVVERAAAGGMSIEMHVEHARMKWDMEHLRRELEARDADDDDDDREPAPALPATLFGMSGDQTFQFLSGLKDVVVPLLSPLQRQQGIAGAPAAPQLSPKELELFEAFRRFGAAQPEAAKSVIDDLLSTYGPNAKPAPDGQG